MIEIWPDITTKAIKPPPTIHKIAMGLCMAFGVHISDVRSKKRNKQLVDVRQKIAIEAARYYSQQEIADYFGHSDHTTVNHYLNKRVS